MTASKLLPILAVALVTLTAADSLAQRRSTPLPTGARAPMRDHRMLGVDGQRVSIGSVAGERGTLVVFTCNHCPWAQAWEGRIAALGNEFRGRGVGVIAINPNDPEEYAEDGYEEMQRRARAASMRFPYVVDSTSGVARAFGATRTPEVFLFNGRGRLVYHGAIDDNPHQPEQVDNHYLRDALRALVGGQPIAQATTRSIGCTIKFRGED